MANPNYVDVLRQGVEAWNKWRDQNHDIEKPNLSRADLRHANLDTANLVGTNLSGADLRKANLSIADLSGASLYEANLSETYLRGANLSETNLSGADLSGKDLYGADLSGADLSKADLSGANLFRVNLREADLREVNLSGAGLSGGDLSGAKLNRAHLSGADLSKADLSGANLSEVLLSGVNLNRANLSGADLSETYLSGADLSQAKLSGVNLSGKDLSRADLSGADVSKADLSEANLYRADVSKADLSEANLEYSIVVRANFKGSTLTNSRIYGISAWDLMVSEETEQSNLIINPHDSDHFVTVDDLEVAQFVYLLLDNRKLRNVIQTMTSKAVLILGNFASERKDVLDGIKERLRDRDYLPILFDFEGPQNKNLVETVTTVARLSRFVIADITQPRSVPAELEALVPALPSLPVQPLIKSSESPYAMFVDLLQRDSVLKVHYYTGSQDLLDTFDEKVLAPAERKHTELEVARLRAIEEKL